MSSLPPDTPGETPAPRIRWYNYWPKWRRIMMGGALILLVGALVPAIMGEDEAPAWLSNASFIIGYGLLAYGFFLAMTSRRAEKYASSRWTEETKTGWTDEDEEKPEES